jgi:serine O-acetyltransferase
VSAPVSSTAADWTREYKRPGEWNPGKSLLCAIRDYQRYRGRSGWLALVMKRWAALRHRFWSAISGADIPVNCQIEGGLLLPHPNGVVIHPAARIGPNCLIFQQVTLGTRGDGGAPVLAGHVDVGAGAKLLGVVVVGEHARIGANAVVLMDVPPHGVAVGVPAVVQEAGR